MALNEDKSRAPAVESAIRILELISLADYPLTLTEICQQLDIPNSTGHRIIAELQNKEMVDLDTTRQKAYNLGSKIFKMASAVYNKQRLIPYFHPLAEILKNEVNQAVLLTIPLGRNVIVIAKIEPSLSNNPEIYVGKTMPMHACAAGKAILSMRPARQLENYLSSTLLKSLTNNTITDVAQLREDIIRCRRLGYAIAIQELSDGLTAISAPILNLNNESIAAISIYSPDHHELQARMRDHSRHLIQAARQLSSRIQHT